MARRSIGSSLTLGITLLVLVIALAIGWQILVWKRGLGDVEWLFTLLGAVFFLTLMAGLIWLCVGLLRELELNQSQRAFLDAVTHELRTPLASMRLYVDTLERHDPEQPRRREFLARMRADLDRLDHTVQQVLTAARAEANPRPKQLGAVALAEVLGECIDEIRLRHGLAEPAIQLEFATQAPVRGDAAELAVVFRNLFDNAVRYSGEPVEIRVRVSEVADGRVEVEIIDRGIGIPSGELEKIFQRFHRASRDVQRTASGLGLGLFIVRNLLRRQGGRIRAISEGRDRGSRFVVTLRAAA